MEYYLLSLLQNFLSGGKINCNESARRSRAEMHEESPSTAGHGCRVTPCQGDLKESATEIYRTATCKGGNVR